MVDDYYHKLPLITTKNIINEKPPPKTHNVKDRGNGGYHKNIYYSNTVLEAINKIKFFQRSKNVKFSYQFYLLPLLVIL